MSQPQGIQRAGFLSSSVSNDGVLHSIALKGGFQEMISLEERNSIPLLENSTAFPYNGFTASDDPWSSGRRRVGMMVSVLENNKTFQLIPVGFFGNGGNLGETEWLALSEWERALRIDPTGSYTLQAPTPGNNFTSIVKTASDIGITADANSCWVELEIRRKGDPQLSNGGLYVISNMSQIENLKAGAAFFLKGNDGTVVNYGGTPQKGVFSEIENDNTETTTVRSSNGINTFVFRATAIEEASLPLGIGNPFENVDDQFAFQGRPAEANVIINEFQHIVGALPIGISFRGRYVGQYFRTCNFTAVYTDGTTETFTSTVTSHQSRHDFKFNNNGSRTLEEIRINLQDPASPQNPGIVHFQMHFPEIVSGDGLYYVNEDGQSYTPLILV